VVVVVVFPVVVVVVGGSSAFGSNQTYALKLSSITLVDKTDI
jgi:hypothetical protein